MVRREGVRSNGEHIRAQEHRACVQPVRRTAGPFQIVRTPRGRNGPRGKQSTVCHVQFVRNEQVHLAMNWERKCLIGDNYIRDPGRKDRLWHLDEMFKGLLFAPIKLVPHRGDLVII